MPTISGGPHNARPWWKRTWVWTTALVVACLMGYAFVFAQINAIVMQQRPLNESEVVGTWVGETTGGTIAIHTDGTVEVRDVELREWSGFRPDETQLVSGSGSWRFGHAAKNELWIKVADADDASLQLFSARDVWGQLSFVLVADIDSARGEERFIRQSD